MAKRLFHLATATVAARAWVPDDASPSKGGRHELRAAWSTFEGTFAPGRSPKAPPKVSIAVSFHRNRPRRRPRQKIATFEIPFEVTTYEIAKSKIAFEGATSRNASSEIAFESPERLFRFPKAPSTRLRPDSHLLNSPSERRRIRIATCETAFEGIAS